MRYIFLIASHINVEIRVETLRRALASIVLAKPDHIYLSYSVDESYKDRHPEFEDIWRLECLKDTEQDSCTETPEFSILYQPERKLQFEHYNILKDLVLDDDIVSFSDDDDLTHKDKVHIIRNHFMNNEHINMIIHEMEMFLCSEMSKDTIDNVEKMSIYCYGERHRREYTCLNFRGWLFKDWFNNNEKYTNNSFEKTIQNLNGVTDIMFLASFGYPQFYQSQKPEHISTLEIPDKLYIHRCSPFVIKRAYNK